MNAKDDLTRRDLELLSGYIDGELSGREKAKLERRFESEPELKLALAELQETVRLLRELPPVKPPRRYTLNAEMAGLPSPPRAYPVLRLATALATLAFFVVVGIDALSGPVLDMAGEAQLAAPAAEKAAEVQDYAQMESPEVELETDAKESTAMPEEPMAVGEVQAEAKAEEAQLFPTPTICDTCTEALGAEQLEEEQERAMTAPPAEGAAPLAEASETPPADALDSVEPTAQPSPTEQKATLTPVPVETPERVVRYPTFWTPLRFVEIGLGAVALFLGGLTIWIQKRA